MAEQTSKRGIGWKWLILAGVAAAVVTLGLVALLTNIFQRQQ